MPELLKTERNPLRGTEIWAVHRLDVKVGLRGVPGVAASTDLIACAHPVAGRHLDGASLKVHESHAMRPLDNLDDDVVSRDGGKSLPNSLGLTQSVRDASQDGTARHVVGLAVVNGDHGSRNGRVQGTTEGVEELWRFGGEERTHAACWSRETIVVDGDEVKRVRGGEQVSLPWLGTRRVGLRSVSHCPSNGSFPMTPPSGMSPGVFLLIMTPPAAP